MTLASLKAEVAAKDKEARAASIALRDVFRTYISDPELRAAADADPEVFHQVLQEAAQHEFVHYSRLATGMGLQDTSNASRWFRPKESDARKTPDQFRRRFALAALARIIERDIERMQAGLSAIGGLSIKDHPELEFTVPRDAA